MSYNDANNFPFNRKLFFIFFSISFLEQKEKNKQRKGADAGEWQGIGIA